MRKSKDIIDLLEEKTNCSNNDIIEKIKSELQDYRRKANELLLEYQASISAICTTCRILSKEIAENVRYVYDKDLNISFYELIVEPKEYENSLYDYCERIITCANKRQFLKIYLGQFRFKADRYRIKDSIEPLITEIKDVLSNISIDFIVYANPSKYKRVECIIIGPHDKKKSPWEFLNVCDNDTDRVFTLRFKIEDYHKEFTDGLNRIKRHFDIHTVPD